MNSRIFLIYTFKTMSNREKNNKNNKNFLLGKINKKFINEKYIQTFFNWQRYTFNFFYNKFPFFAFGFIWFIGNKTGKYIVEKYIFKKPNAKFLISEIF